MPSDQDEIDRKLDINLQIAILRHNLDENERSWIACGLGMIHNTIADSIRSDIAVQEALLNQGQS
jgi:hypothetical protein